jgi:hypothetical protein
MSVVIYRQLQHLHRAGCMIAVAFPQPGLRPGPFGENRESNRQ